MPELPEVEVTRRAWSRWATGKQVVEASGGLEALAGRYFGEIARRGKFMLASLSDGAGLLLHLGMTGSLVAQPSAEALPKHTRAWWVLSDGVRVCFCDPRKFGEVVLGTVEQLRPRLLRLGPDPYSEGLSAEQLAGILSKSRQPIKCALLDQAKLAGIGNIQASEALFRARIRPTVAAGSLGRARITALTEGIHATLRFTLEAIGELWPPPYLQNGVDSYFLVYDREGEPCPSCATPIRRLVQAGRSTFYCPSCQAR